MEIGEDIMNTFLRSSITTCAFELFLLSNSNSYSSVVFGLVSSHLGRVLGKEVVQEVERSYSTIPISAVALIPWCPDVVSEILNLGSEFLDLNFELSVFGS